MLSRLFAFLQHLLPKYWLTSLTYHVARIRVPFVKNALIRAFVRLYKVRLDEVPLAVPGDYPSFNAFFTRELRPGARPLETDERCIVSPADGTLSQAGSLEGDRILQAKGLDYSLADLLAADLDNVRAYASGSFATIYLAPYNYHRVHAPLDGELLAAHYVPGDLFSVNASTARRIRGLFRRNERLNLHFRSAHGPWALIFVGALNVGSISTPWSGEIRPRKTGVVDNLDVSAHTRNVARGDLLGWFNMGSTVIVLMPKGRCAWRSELQPGATIRVGAAIGELAGTGQ